MEMLYVKDSIFMCIMMIRVSILGAVKNVFKFSTQNILKIFFTSNESC
jgi:hypothetical protein